MAYYFDDSKSIEHISKGSTEKTLLRIAERYLRKNPAHTFTARPYISTGIHRGSDYRYAADFARIYPDAPDGSYVYVRGCYRSSASSELKFLVIPGGPVKIWMNGKLLYATDIFAERYVDRPVSITLPVKRGINYLVLRFTKDCAGFGGKFGTWLGKLDYFFTRTLSGYTEMEGFDYTDPVSEPLEELQNHPDTCTDRFVVPSEWSPAEKVKGCFGRLYGTGKEMKGRTAAALAFVSAEQGSYAFECIHDGDTDVYLGSRKVCSFTGCGTDTGTLELSGRKEKLTLYTVCPGTDRWNAELKFTGKKSTDAVLKSVFFDSRTPESAAQYIWSYTGPFHTAYDFHFDRTRLAGTAPDVHWYHLDKRDCWVRLYNENALFGHWNYPLGVTLYGLTELSRYLILRKTVQEEGKRLSGYIQQHVRTSVSAFDYACFDRDTFGGATSVHHLLTSIDSLDDCGSFGSLMLETAKDHQIGNYEPIAEYIGSYILHHQSRLADGTFFRKEMMHHFHNGTMWADDLYMSIPFLCRYAALTGNDAIFDDAASQFMGFKKRLYMEDTGLMAHVYDFNRGMNTGIPWGRGNGWTVFSLTELLRVLPEQNQYRSELLQFFRDLAASYLKVQDKEGMWHQVLNMPSSYPETSCTAMFICAFSRGIRNGWFDCDTEPYRNACLRAWKAIEHTSVDVDGNVYGVCRGSEFAFNPRYYAQHLLPRLNDTHGIGIVLLAGVEMLRLSAFKA